MHRIHKGEYGYITGRRKQVTALVIGMLAIVLMIYFGAYAILGTNQNLFTILAALICLPTAKMAVNMIMFYKASGCSENAYQAITEHVGDLTGAYDLYMTTDRENYAISHLVIGSGSVLAFTEDPKCSAGHAQTHIRQMMQGNGYHGYAVKVFSSLDSYTDRLDALRDLAPGEEQQEAEVLHLMEQISL